MAELRSFILRTEVLHLYRQLLRVTKGARDPAARGQALPLWLAAATAAVPPAIGRPLMRRRSLLLLLLLVCCLRGCLSLCSLLQRSCGTRSDSSLTRTGGPRSSTLCGSCSATAG